MFARELAVGSLYEAGWDHGKHRTTKRFSTPQNVARETAGLCSQKGHGLHTITLRGRAISHHYAYQLSTIVTIKTPFGEKAKTKEKSRSHRNHCMENPVAMIFILFYFPLLKRIGIDPARFNCPILTTLRGIYLAHGSGCLLFSSFHGLACFCFFL